MKISTFQIGGVTVGIAFALMAAPHAQADPGGPCRPDGVHEISSPAYADCARAHPSPVDDTWICHAGHAPDLSQNPAQNICNLTGACGQSAVGEPPKSNMVTYHMCGGSSFDASGNLTYEKPCNTWLHSYGPACTDPSVPDRNNNVTWEPDGCDPNNPDSGNNPSKQPGFRFPSN